MSSRLSRTALAWTTIALKLGSYVLTHLIPRDKNVWVFTVNSSDGRFAENTKYLFLHANERRSEEGVRPIWIDRNRELVSLLRDSGYEAYHPTSLRGIALVLRAGRAFFVSPNYLWPLTGGCTIVQMWHGNILKNMGFDNDRITGATSLARFTKRIAYDWDRIALTSPNAPFEAFASAFGITDSETIITGYPRNDVLFKDIEDAELGSDSATYKRIESLAADCTIVSYLPTWRRAAGNADGEKVDEGTLEPERLQSLLREHDAHLLIKLHPSSELTIANESFDRIDVLPPAFDVSLVLKHTDVLVTDYSSLFFDFLLLDHPILFYPFDQESYERVRGFYFEYEEVTPGPKARTPAELHQWLLHFLEGNDGFEAERERIRNEFHEYVDGEASKRIYEQISDT